MNDVSIEMHECTTATVCLRNRSNEFGLVATATFLNERIQFEVELSIVLPWIKRCGFQCIQAPLELVIDALYIVVDDLCRRWDQLVSNCQVLQSLFV